MPGPTLLAAFLAGEVDAGGAAVVLAEVVVAGVAGSERLHGGRRAAPPHGRALAVRCRGPRAAGGEELIATAVTIPRPAVAHDP
ncbi:hypothetical protein [Cellulomonas triticagri]|uniref:Uncharacterized protein n=1 Tax=Cellulomonas triticagri TaxID=2483352 RepID=A0A3M2JIX6_9CELL|nr:hypothetical protein [Cellulomonas triticagri]RMI13034.1 hypothetical protein EBM89_06005 [Cellulomonas triticagri]